MGTNRNQAWALAVALAAAGCSGSAVIGVIEGGADRDSSAEDAGDTGAAPEASDDDAGAREIQDIRDLRNRETPSKPVVDAGDAGQLPDDSGATTGSDSSTPADSGGPPGPDCPPPAGETCGNGVDGGHAYVSPVEFTGSGEAWLEMTGYEFATAGAWISEGYEVLLGDRCSDVQYESLPLGPRIANNDPADIGNPIFYIHVVPVDSCDAWTLQVWSRDDD